MSRDLGAGIILLVLQVTAFYPVWLWYAARMTDGSDEPWGLVALATALFFVMRRKGGNLPKSRCALPSPYPSPKGRGNFVIIPGGSRSLRERVGVRVSHGTSPSLLFPALSTLFYAASYFFAPRLIQAATAVAAIGCMVSALRWGKVAHAPTLCLLLLSLPVVPSLQFYLGYPFRVVAGALAAPLLQMAGFAVVREGACLFWGSEVIFIDAPCSGVRMLWTGLFCAFAVASFLDLSNSRTMIAACFAVCAIILGNALRAAALFYVEAGIVSMPWWGHEAVGITVFLAVSSIVIWLVHAVKGRNPCEAQVCL